MEIASSSAAIDLGAKKAVYRRNGVQEYLVWQTFEQKLNWFRLEREEYRLITPDAEGRMRSVVFPGLWLAVPALVNGEMATVVSQLQAGLASPEHQAFVQKLSIS